MCDSIDLTGRRTLTGECLLENEFEQFGSVDVAEREIRTARHRAVEIPVQCVREHVRGIDDELQFTVPVGFVQRMVRAVRRDGQTAVETMLPEFVEPGIPRGEMPIVPIGVLFAAVVVVVVRRLFVDLDRRLRFQCIEVTIETIRLIRHQFQRQRAHGGLLGLALDHH